MLVNSIYLTLRPFALALQTTRNKHNEAQHFAAAWKDSFSV